MCAPLVHSLKGDLAEEKSLCGLRPGAAKDSARSERRDVYSTVTVVYMLKNGIDKFLGECVHSRAAYEGGKLGLDVPETAERSCTSISKDVGDVLLLTASYTTLRGCLEYWMSS